MNYVEITKEYIKSNGLELYAEKLLELAEFFSKYKEPKVTGMNSRIIDLEPLRSKWQVRNKIEQLSFNDIKSVHLVDVNPQANLATRHWVEVIEAKLKEVVDFINK